MYKTLVYIDNTKDIIQQQKSHKVQNESTLYRLLDSAVIFQWKPLDGSPERDFRRKRAI
jgi:hypothetical protein